MTRRMNGEGSIVFDRNRKKWVLAFSVNGNRIYRYGKSKAEVKQKLKELQTRQTQGLSTVTASMPIRDYLNEWLELKKPNLRTSTYEGYESLIRAHLIPRFGNIKLNKLTAETINRIWNKMLDDGHSPSLIHHCHNRLSKALNDAIRRQLIDNNPIQYVTKPTTEAKEMHILDTTQIQHVLRLAKETAYYPIVHTALHTGLRRNELLGLRWKDIDTHEGMIYLSRSVYQAKGGVTLVQAPKTNSSKRSVTLPNASSELLQELRLQQELDSFLHGYKVNENSPIFIRRTGERLLPSAVTHGFKALVRAIGMDNIRFHDLRHTHASILLKQGEHPKVVQERLGHAKISTTMDVYSHVMPTLQKEAAQRFNLELEPASLT